MSINQKLRKYYIYSLNENQENIIICLHSLIIVKEFITAKVSPLAEPCNLYLVLLSFLHFILFLCIPFSILSFSFAQKLVVLVL